MTSARGPVLRMSRLMIDPVWSAAGRGSSRHDHRDLRAVLVRLGAAYERAEHCAEDRVADDLLASDPRAGDERRPRAVAAVWMDPVGDRHRRPEQRVLDPFCDNARLHAPKAEPFERGAEDSAVHGVRGET